MRICVVEPRGSGGMIHYAYQLCNSMADYVSEVTLVTSTEYEMENNPHKFHVEKLLRLWGRTDPLQTTVSRNFLDALFRKSLRALRRIYRGYRYVAEWMRLSGYLLKTRPDVVQFGSIEFPFEAIFLHYLKIRGLKLSQICHEFEPRERSNKIFVRMNNYMLGSVFESFSVMFFHSLSNQERFQQLFPRGAPGRFKVIPMGNGHIFPVVANSELVRERLAVRYQIAGNTQVVLFFGNITPSKGIPDLLRAFALIHPVKENAKLIVAGKPLKYMDVNALLDLASELGVQSAVQFDLRYLPMDEVAPLIELANVVVFPYVSSTQSASIQAAYALGKPVVATCVGGLPDIVEDGKSGFLVSPGNPPELSDAILKLLDNDRLSRQMGKYAEELSKSRFAWGPIAAQVVNTYAELVH